MDYGNHFSAHVRLAILKFLAAQPGHRANDSILTSILPDVGLTATRDQVRTELAWLAEQRLVVQEEPGPMKLIIIDITERGLDVAAGRAAVPGVQRPAPRF